MVRFADIFAGLGGFHLALSNLGAECVFASELNTNLADLYEKNFGIKPVGDIRQEWQNVPDHDVLCAGFPCQPFSKAGEQKGFDCVESGDLFKYVAKILEMKRPPYVILENVPNLKRHDSGRTWDAISTTLFDLGYDVSTKNLSPDMFGIPHKRERIIRHDDTWQCHWLF